MAKFPISNKIFTKKTNDFTFAIMFFLIFSIFIFFAIRPSLSIAFSLQREEVDLRRVDSIYEKKIAEVITIQSQIEKGRDRVYLLNQAIPNYPELNKILKDLSNLNYFSMAKTNIGEVSLATTDNPSLMKLKISMEGVSDFETALKLIKDLMDQRRLKTIQRLVFSRDAVGTQSGQLRVVMDIEAYYL